jgi:hypothetical protein
MKRGEIKIKYVNSRRRVENEIWDNYWFVLPVRASHFRSVSKTVSIPKDLGHRCSWRTCHSRRGFLDALRKFHRKKILGCAGLLIGCHSILWPSVSQLRVTFHVLWQHLHASYPSQARELVDSNLAIAREVLGVVDELLLSTFMLMIPLILSMVALTDFRKGFPRMMEVYW